jgi:putative oxidoreductase
VGVLHRIVTSRAPCSTFLVRLIVGGTILIAGIRGFLCGSDLVAERLAETAMPWATFFVTLLCLCEAGCGVMLTFGLLTRLAAFVVIAIMSVAVLSIEFPFYWEHHSWLFDLPTSNSSEFWSAMQRAFRDFTVLLGALFLLIVGAGIISIDSLLARFCRAYEAERALRTPRAWAGIDLDARLPWQGKKRRSLAKMIGHS